MAAPRGTRHRSMDVMRLAREGLPAWLEREAQPVLQVREALPGLQVLLVRPALQVQTPAKPDRTAQLNGTARLNGTRRLVPAGHRRRASALLLSKGKS